MLWCSVYIANDIDEPDQPKMSHLGQHHNNPDLGLGINAAKRKLHDQVNDVTVIATLDVKELEEPVQSQLYILYPG